MKSKHVIPKVLKIFSHLNLVGSRAESVGDVYTGLSPPDKFRC